MARVSPGKAVALGVFDERRLPLARDVPTFKELDFDVTLGSIPAIIAPRGTPGPVVKALDEAIRKAGSEPPFVLLAERTQNMIDYKGPEAFAADVRQSLEKNPDLVRNSGAQ